jgi:RNA polymerase sigma-70 factor (ECF subfamily)
MTDSESLELVQRARQGDATAEAALFERYVSRLLQLSQARISSKLGRRVDGEDIVQSVYRSFFVHLREGRFDFQASGDLWRLLAAMAIRKVNRQVQRHSAEKRAMRTEESVAERPDATRLSPEEIARDPPPEVVVELVDELEHLFSTRPPEHRRIVELRLQGHSIPEIARTVNCSERTVHRVLAECKKQLDERSGSA